MSVEGLEWHTSASLMLNNGVDIFVASKRLGHSRPSITLDVYGHISSSAQNDVANKMEILIKWKISAYSDKFL